MIERSLKKDNKTQISNPKIILQKSLKKLIEKKRSIYFLKKTPKKSLKKNKQTIYSYAFTCYAKS